MATPLKYGVGLEMMKNAQINGICHDLRHPTSRFKLNTKNDEVGCLKSWHIPLICGFFIISKPTPYFKGVATVCFDLTWTPTLNPHHYIPAKCTPFPKIVFPGLLIMIFGFSIQFAIIWYSI